MIYYGCWHPPTGVASCMIPIGSAPREVRYPEEEAAIAGSAPKRRAEFLAGRACSRIALAALGVLPQAIGVTADRRPRWPEGYVGSISHSDSHCVSIVARSERFSSLGIDLEPATPLTTSLIPLVVHGLDRLGRGPQELEAKKAFVAKEAYYKALYPLRPQMLDFLDVSIDVEAEGCGTFRGTLTVDGTFEMRGQMAIVAGHYLGLVAVEPAFVTGFAR